jgi:plastocyanin domain-containing protein
VFLRVIGVVVLGFALVNAVAGLRLLGVSPAIDVARAKVPAPVVTMEDGKQVIRTFQVSSGYTPADTALYAGVPTRWIVESLDSNTCAAFLEVPSLGLSVTLHKGENTIDLPPLEPGRVSYTCSMGMYGGTLTVVEASSGAPGGPPSG